MIAWKNPVAFWAFAALAVPVVIHLLQRRRASRVRFPTDRFVRPSVTGAVRVRLPADLALLLVRLAIVATAVCALAQPAIVTPARLRAWNARVARAVVVDASASMTDVAPAAEAAASRELRSAAHAIRISSADLADGIRRASAGLAGAPPAQREIVVISDFQSGALTAADLGVIPQPIGVRFARVGDRVPVRHVAGPLLLAAGGRSRRAEIDVHSDRTAVAFADGTPQTAGLRLAGGTDVERGRVLKAVAASGAPGPAPDEPIVVQFGQTEGQKGGQAEGPKLERRWMLETALGLRGDPDLIQAADDGAALRVAPAGDALRLDVDADAGSFAAAAALRGVLTARRGSPARAHAEDEVRTMADDRLDAWSREPSGVSRGDWRRWEHGDARWAWAGVLLLLGVETFARARRT